MSETAEGVVRLGGVAHTWRCVRASWMLDLKSAEAFRANALVGIGISLAYMFFAIAPVLAAGRYLGQGDGWTQARLLFLQGVWYWMDAVIWTFCSRGVSELTEAVHTGRLDGLLLLPGDSLTRIMLGHISVGDLPKFLIAMALGGYAIAAGAFPGSVWTVLSFIICLGAASVIMWTVAAFSILKIITLFEFDGTFALNAVHDLGRVPVSLYAPWLRIIFSSVLPVILITTVPSTVFFGWSSWWTPIVPVAVAALLVWLLRLAWRHEIRNYVGLQG